MFFQVTLARILLLVLLVSAPASEVDAWVFYLMPAGAVQGAGFCPIEEDPVIPCMDRRAHLLRAARRLCRAVRTKVVLQQGSPVRSSAMVGRPAFVGPSSPRSSPTSPRDPPRFS